METKRCYFTLITLDDYYDVKSLYTNNKVRKYLGGAIKEEKFDRIFPCMVQKATHTRVVKEKKTEQFIGLITLDRHHNGIDTEVSYLLSPRQWGKGYACEVVKEMITFAFENLKLPRLVAETQTANEASCYLLEKLGMNHEKTVTRFGAEQRIYAIYPEKG
ncbi:GNAT family N-acetyltransferase [Sutcliffiella cohnii]|uniref:GNAT family N-acetyltransferase n=1 Tax=Sutcliffiella cohnii TaxID=33932 RepID=UPI002E1E569A|nr:GNAT family N-acetyltransferase [Sutcliffiella cohnii]